MDRPNAKAERRARLIEAAIVVYGEAGFKKASVKGVCQAAGLTERYFYEAFANSEALLIAAYDAVNTRLIAMVRDAGALSSEGRERAMMAAFFLGLKHRPREAHLFLVEVRGVGPAGDAAITAWVDRFGELIRQILGVGEGDRLLVRRTVGGLLHLAIAWIEAGTDRSVEDVVDQALILCAGLRSVGR